MPAVLETEMTVIALIRRPFRQTASRRGWFAATLVALALTLAGCASLSGEAQTAAEPVAEARPTVAPRAAAVHEPRYLRYRPDETGLIEVFDDGRDTYLEFRDPVARQLTLHDTDGRLIAHVASGRVAAVPGLHTGLLTRIGSSASYASPNPRRTQDLTRELPERVDFVEARAQLHSNGDLRAAMERALQAADAVTEADTPAAGARAGQRARAAAPRSVIVERGASGRLAPLSAANLSTLQPESGLIRVYFARASRAIVAPDDGLGVLLRVAPRADRIVITGYTDAEGSRAENLALARSRADAVAQILLRRGVDPMRIELDAVIDAPVTGKEAERSRAMSRRAEIQMMRDGRPLDLGALR